MSSTSPQPIPQIPPIESLAPPLPDAMSAVAAQSPETELEPKLEPKPKDESWVPVEVHGGAENTSSKSTNLGRNTESTGTVKIATATNPSSTLFSRVLKQRSSVLPQTAHVQKDNTLAIFVTLCLVVVAIACGIYFVADRETQNQESNHATPALVQNEITSNIAPPAQSLQNTASQSHNKLAQQATPNPLFGKPGKPTEKAAAQKATTAAAPKLSKAVRLTVQSQTELSRMQYIEAESFAQQATKLVPASGDAWLALGRAQYAQGRYTEAMRAFKTCIKRDSQSKAASSAADFMSQMPALGQTK